MRNRTRRLTAWMAVGAMLLMLLLAGVGKAETASLAEAEAISLLRTYGIVRGDPSGNLLLDQRLTRAQAAAIFVRSMGADPLASGLADLVPFPDARGHWGAGEIAMAYRMGLVKGDGDGLFRPDSDITYAEVMTVLLRMVTREPDGAWDPGRIIAAAAQLGIAPATTLPNAPAIRREIFHFLTVAVSQVPLASGKTVLQTYVDSIPPRLIPDAAAINSFDEQVLLTGAAAGASRVEVDGLPAALDAASGRYRISIAPPFGTSQHTVTARDLAGNAATALITVERLPKIAQLSISGPDLMRVGSTSSLTVAARDGRGRSVPALGITASLTGAAATFNVETGTLKAGSAIGDGVLTLRSGAAVASFRFRIADQSARARRLLISQVGSGGGPTVLKETRVEVRVVDEAGQLVADDYFRPVALTADGPAGVVVLSPAAAATAAGAAAFTVKSALPGQATLRAMSPGLNDGWATVQFLTATRVVLTASPAALPPDGVSRSAVAAVLRDENGRAIANTTGADIVVALAAGGTDGTLNAGLLTIARGASSSPGLYYTAGVMNQTATIAGQVISGQNHSVLPTAVQAAALPGVRLQVTYSAASQAPGGAGVPVTVRVVDGANRLVTTGAYAFQFRVSTSNGEALQGGLPEGVMLTFDGSPYRPVDDGRSTADPANDPYAVVGRTYQGSATLRLTYAKSGYVTLTPVLLSATTTAYNPVTGFGRASASASLAADAAKLTFAGPPTRVVLTADSALGQQQPAGATLPGGSMKLRATVVDAFGTPVIGYPGTVTLSRTAGGSVTSVVGAASALARDGVAEFAVKVLSVAGYDTYVARTGSFSSPALVLSVRTAIADRPTVEAVRGIRAGDSSPVTGYVAPDATQMDVQLSRQSSAIAGEPGHWVLARLFRKGESAPFYTQVVDLRADLPMLHVPKSLLRAGTAAYEVSLQNGYGESPRSLDLGLSTALNAVYNPAFRMTDALVDSQTGRLELRTASLQSTGVIRTERLRIRSGAEMLGLGDPTVTLLSVGAGNVILDLGGLAAALDPDRFHGVVTVEAQEGWYTSPGGDQVAEAVLAAPMRPSAVISHALLDAPAHRLSLYGEGFTQGSLSLGLIRLEQDGQVVTLRPGSTSTTDRVVSLTDSLVTIALSQQTLDAIDGLSGPGIAVTAGAGWIRVSANSRLYGAQAITGPGHRLYVRGSVSSVGYDRSTGSLILGGSGFAGAVLNPARLSFRAAGSAAVWRPSSTATAEVLSDASIRVMLSASDRLAFQSAFSGKSVFMNTDSDWLVDGHYRPAAPIPANSILFFVSSS